MKKKIIKRIKGIYNHFKNYIYYIRFKFLFKIKFTNWKYHKEIIHNPYMYINKLFIPKKNDVIFDIGSQYGDYSILWEKRYNAIVYSFELLENNYIEMLKDLRLNNSKVNSFNMAIGNGKNISFKVNGDMAINEYSYNFIKTVKLDDLIFNKLDVKPNIIKIDVEGFEFNVLNGSFNTLKIFHPKIIIETHSKELRIKCNQFLENLNYYLYYKGRMVKGNDWMNEITNLFYIYKGNVNEEKNN